MKLQAIEERRARAKQVMENKTHSIGPEYFQNVKINRRLNEIAYLMKKNNLDFEDIDRAGKKATLKASQSNF